MFEFLFLLIIVIVIGVFLIVFIILYHLAWSVAECYQVTSKRITKLEQRVYELSRLLEEKK